MEDSVFGEVPREGESVEEALNSVDKEQQDAPAESQTEKAEETEEEPDLKRNEAWKELREARDKEREQREALEARLAVLEKGNTEEVPTSEFVTSLVGENAEVEKKWSEERSRLKEEAKREFAQEQIDAQTKVKEQQERWVKWTEDRLTEVEKEFNVDFKANESLKNELSVVMQEYTPTDEKGNLDYRKGMKLLTELSKLKVDEEKQKTKVKKDVADATVSKETSVPQNKGFYTSNDLRGKDWRSLIHN